MESGFRTGLAAAALALLMFSGTSFAGEGTSPLGVVELFTSQGCSSCPPADKLFGELAARGDIVALAYHVDYWDYLGWHDTLASEENSARQYGYMQAFDNRSVYTPQAIINGRADARAANPGEIERTLLDLKAGGKGLNVPISVRRAGDTVVIEAGEGSPDARAAIVLVSFAPPTPIAIRKGENKGKNITYWNAVLRVQTVGMWRGAFARIEMPATEVERKGAGGCAVLLQSVSADGRPGPILGAAIVRKQ
ncbi:MAG TPA: DUF1223 domain-containing protein [Rhizobiales bacterium]|nr:DUF1223 domain-containing protein [Hyphomicrobiales bacterium]